MMTALILIGLLTVSNFIKLDEELILFHELEVKLLPHSATSLEDKAESEIPVWSIIKSRDFILLYMISILFMFYGYYLMNMFKILGSETI